jgi:hypothetical protein
LDKVLAHLARAMNTGSADSEPDDDENEDHTAMSDDDILCDCPVKCHEHDAIATPFSRLSPGSIVQASFVLVVMISASASLFLLSSLLSTSQRKRWWHEIVAFF